VLVLQALCQNDKVARPPPLPNEKLVSARREAWEGKNPGDVRVLLANPRWERRFVRFLELSSVGRIMADGTSGWYGRLETG